MVIFKSPVNTYLSVTSCTSLKKSFFSCGTELWCSSCTSILPSSSNFVRTRSQISTLKPKWFQNNNKEIIKLKMKRKRSNEEKYTLLECIAWMYCLKKQCKKTLLLGKSPWIFEYMSIYKLQELAEGFNDVQRSCQVTAFSSSLLQWAFSNPANSSPTPKLPLCTKEHNSCWN